MKLWIDSRVSELDGFRVVRSFCEAKQVCCQLRRPGGTLAITDIYLGSKLDDIGCWRDGQKSFLLWLEWKEAIGEFSLTNICFHILPTTKERKNRLQMLLQGNGWVND